jgi:hypothetical protein
MVNYIVDFCWRNLFCCYFDEFFIYILFNFVMDGYVINRFKHGILHIGPGIIPPPILTRGYRLELIWESRDDIEKDML